MKAFNTFFEQYKNEDVTVDNIRDGLGVELSTDELRRIMAFPVQFNDKLAIRQVNVDKSYKETNDLFIRKLISIVLACMGYSTRQQGFKLPKTKVFLKRQDPGDTTSAGFHAHWRGRSWSHEIELFLDYLSDIEELVSATAHECAHSLQVSRRRLHTPITDDEQNIRWDKEWYSMKGSEHDDYLEQPWEADAVKRAEEATKYVMQYIKSGNVRGFDIRKV